MRRSRQPKQPKLKQPTRSSPPEAAQLKQPTRSSPAEAAHPKQPSRSSPAEAAQLKWAQLKWAISQVATVSAERVTDESWVAPAISWKVTGWV